MLTLNFLISTILNLYVKILLLRVWMQLAKCDFYNPFSQFIITITHPILKLVRHIIPSIGSIDIPSLLLAWIIKVAMLTFLLALQNRVFLFEPIFLYFGLLSIMKAAGTLVFWITIIRSLIIWINQNYYSSIDYVLIQLTEPLIAPIRRLLPKISGIDFSSMTIILILYMLNLLGMDFIPGWVQI